MLKISLQYIIFIYYVQHNLYFAICNSFIIKNFFFFFIFFSKVLNQVISYLEQELFLLHEIIIIFDLLNHLVHFLHSIYAKLY